MTEPVLLRRREPMWSRGPRLLDRLTFAIMCVTLLVELSSLVATTLGLSGLQRSGEPLGGYVAVVMAGAGLAVARRYPWWGIALISTAPIASAALGWDPTATWSLACFAAFWFALRGQPGLPVALVFGCANLAAVGWFEGTIRPTEAAIPSVAALVAVLMATTGSAVRGHQQYWFSLEQRTQEAVASRQVAVERSLAQERLRIARDLHDSIGHQIAVVNVHLGTAEVHLPASADQSREDLHAARAAVQEVLRETQQILRILRFDGGEAREPTPGFEQIHDLVAGVRATGLAVELSMPPTAPSVRPEVGTAAYRIAQEALTNARRHGTGSASMTIAAAGGMLTIDVTNERHPRRGHSGGGHGLVGMQERAVSVGGHVDSGTDGTQFWIRAQLPADGEAPT